MNRKTHVLLIVSCMLGAAATSAATTALSEDFNALSIGSNLSERDSALDFVRTAGSEPHFGSLNIQASNIGTGNSLILKSSGYGSSPNLTGVGASKLPSSEVWSLSMDIKSPIWTSGTYLYIMMGTGRSNSQQVYSQTGPITTTGVSPSTIGSQSLFALKLNGSTMLNGGYFSAITDTGMEYDSSGAVMTNGTAYALHIVVNGSESDLMVDKITIPTGMMGIYLNGNFSAMFPIATKLSADSLRILAAGNSVGNGSVSIEIDNLKIWNSSVSPRSHKSNLR